MSRIYFHSPSGTAEIRGSERAWFGCLTNALGIAPLRSDLLEVRDLVAWKGDAPRRDAQMVELYLSVGAHKHEFIIGAERANCWDTILNTCIAIGNDALCLATRLHAQCEIHAWVQGSDRAWLAGVIRQGLSDGVFRSDQGWPELITFLHERYDEPVVTSYSVCDQFPNRFAANEGDDEAWYALLPEEQWSLALAGVQVMQFGPESLRRRFGNGKTVFDVLEAMYNVRRRG